MDKLNKMFKLEENNTTVRTEVIGGLVTFLTMAYIIVVNPDILSASGMDKGALVTATCLTAALASIMMGLYANLPIALAPGMGLNAFFAFTVCGVMGIPWEVALAAVFVEGIIFIILSATKVRQKVVNAIPRTLKYAVTAGIGLFIAFIGFANAGIVIADDATMVAAGHFLTPPVIIAFIGILATVIAEIKEIKGSLLIGIVASTVLAWIYASINPAAAAEYLIFAPDFSQGIINIAPVSEIAFKMDFSYMANPDTLLQFITIVITFLFVDFFDTAGTLVGVATKANLLDENGDVKNAGPALMSDAVGTTFGAAMGTSTVTAFVESAAGVAHGAKTGLAAVIAGLAFLVAMVFSPIFIAIPGCATAPALIVVGYMMVGQVANIAFDDIKEGFPAFLIIILMPLTYSIGDGLAYGIMAYGLINIGANLLTKDPSKKKEVSPIMIILTVLFILKFMFI